MRQLTGQVRAFLGRAAGPQRYVPDLQRGDISVASIRTWSSSKFGRYSRADTRLATMGIIEGM